MDLYDPYVELAEFVIVPIVVAALVVAALVSWRRHLHRTKLLLASAALGLDAWLWLAALEPPVGPHSLLVYALLLVNVPIAMGLVYQSTGFQVHGGWYDASDPRQNVKPR